MSKQSLPSKSITVINVPEPTFSKGDFIYNFYTTDESVNENLHETIVQQENATLEESLKFTCPRYIILNFGSFNGIIETVGYGQNGPNYIIDPQNNQETIKQIISYNINNIQTEVSIGGGNFTSVALQDTAGAQAIIDEIYKSARIKRLIDDDRALSPMELALLLQSQTSDMINLNDVINDAEITGNNDISYIDPKTGKQYKGQFDELNELSFAASFDSQYYDSILSRSSESPFSPFFESFSNSLIDARRISTTSKFQSTPGTLKESEFSINVIPIQGVPGYGETIIDTDPVNSNTPNATKETTFFDIKFGEPTFQVIGMLVDKFEVQEDGTEIRKEPFIITNPNTVQIIDKQIKYGVTYRYALSTIAILRNYEYSEEYQDYVRIESLIRSRGGQGKIIKCVETTPPPPPQDIYFKYNYEDFTTTILWNPPVNFQRDIARYQIFRRLSIDDQFDLIGQIDFDQSEIILPRAEHIPDEINLTYSHPKYKFIDTSYDKRKSYIYALCAVDAHDLSSNFSIQYNVDFNLFENQMYVSKFSSGNAPKPFPNLNLSEALSEDSIKVSGYNNMKIYFNPNAFHLLGSSGEDIKYLDRSEEGGGYKLQLINLDRQVAQTINILLKDITN